MVNIGGEIDREKRETINEADTTINVSIKYTDSCDINMYIGSWIMRVIKKNSKKGLYLIVIVLLYCI